jgi:hypothetical protein
MPDSEQDKLTKLGAEIREKLRNATDASEKASLQKQLDDNVQALIDIGKNAIGSNKKSSGGARPTDTQSWLDELDYLIGRVKKQSDPTVKKAFDDRIEELQNALGGGPAARSSGLGQRIHREAEKARQQISLQKTPQQKKQENQDKKLLAAVKSVTQPERKSIFRGGAFSLPQFTTDNSTSIVLACVLIIFFLELHAGTKFVKLWNYSFSPATKTGSGPGNQNHTGLKPLPERVDKSQNLEALNQPILQTFSGGGMMEQYGVPDSFHYLEGVTW